MHKKGVALIITLLVIIVMLILGLAMFSSSINASFIAQRFARATQAFWLAEAGIQSAHRALNDADWTGWTQIETDAYSKTEDLTLGSYSVIARCITCSNPTATSIGNVKGIERTITVRFKTQSPFTSAIFAKANVTMSGNGKTDSYNSSLGPYGDGNCGSNGDVGSNGTTSGVINLSGNTIVNGDAATGPGGTVEISDNAKVTGEITHDNAVDLPAVVVPSCLTDLQSGGSYSVGGSKSTIITTGDYKFSSMSISGNGKVTVVGTVKIYLTDSPALSISGQGQLIVSGGGNLIIYSDGKADIAGNGIANKTNVPSNFILKSTYTDTEGIKISGNGDLQGVIYAPNTSILNSGNGSVFGSMVAKTVTITGNGNVHYDEAVKDLMGFGSYSIYNWLDENNPYPL